MISLTINGIERKNEVQAYSLEIQKTVSKKRNTASFTVVTHSGDTYKPNLGQEVIVYDDAVKIFAGVIINYESRSTGKGVVENRIECQDYVRLLDRKLVPDSFQNQTVNEIIATLKELYFPADFTINNVDCDVMINSALFNYKPLSVVLDTLAKRTNYDWYVDYDKDLHFFLRESNSAPFDIEDSTGVYKNNTLVIRKDNSQIRNKIIVRGGDYEATTVTTEIEANGTDTVFPLPYRYADFKMSLTGDYLDVGTDFLDQAEDHDVLYNFQEKIIRFRDIDAPTAGSIMRVSGRPKLPIIVQYQSSQHINAMISAEGGSGVYEYLILDKSIKTREEALQRAQAEITAYADSLIEGSFETTTSGLEAGMRIRVNSEVFDIDEYYVIQSIRIKQRTTDAFIYSVELISQKTFDLIDILKTLLLKETDQIEIGDNETISLIRSLDDQMTLTDTVSFTSDQGPYKWQPGDGNAKWNFAVWG